jgi:hypothetical protein
MSKVLVILSNLIGGIMLRFIVSRNWKDSVSGAECQNFITIDGDITELEKLLRSGGYGENGYEYYHLIGVEILEF